MKTLLGEGGFRNVYSFDENSVIKIPKPERFEDARDCNYLEWEIWNLVKDTEYKYCFCPCVKMNGDNLIAKKAIPILTLPKYQSLNKKKYYYNIPDVNLSKLDFIKSYDKRAKELKCKKSDLVAENLGLYNDRIVVIDYGQKIILKAFKDLFNT